MSYTKEKNSDFYTQRNKIMKNAFENASGVTKLLFEQNNKSHSEKVKESEESLTFYEGFLYRTMKSVVSQKLKDKFGFSQKDINKMLFEMEIKMCGLHTMKQFHKTKIVEGDTYFEKYSK